MDLVGSPVLIARLARFIPMISSLVGILPVHLRTVGGLDWEGEG